MSPLNANSRCRPLDRIKRAWCRRRRGERSQRPIPREAPWDGFERLEVRLMLDGCDQPLPGDVDGDGLANVEDIDAMYVRINAGDNDPQYDLNGDGVVDEADADQLIEIELYTRRGDANQDYAVTIRDLADLATYFGQDAARWRKGDFNGDLVVSMADLQLLATYFDFRRPYVVGGDPDICEELGEEASMVEVRVSEPLAPATVTTGHFTILEAGVDEMIGTSDDTSVATIALELLDGGTRVRLTTEPIGVGVYALRIDAEHVTNVPGTPLGVMPHFRYFSIQFDPPTFGIVEPVADEFDVGMRPSAVQVGDVNGDGVPDIVTANQTDSTVSVLLGDGTGGFGGARSFAVDVDPRALALADLNGDGAADIVTANQGPNSMNLNDTITVLLSDGAGGSGSRTDYVVGLAPASLAIGDMNGDGDLDIVTAAGGHAVILQGDGMGGFAAPMMFALPFLSTVSLAVGDVNGDDDLDLVAAFDSGAAVLLGDGEGGLGPAVEYNLREFTASLALGDMDGDDDLDIVTANDDGLGGGMVVSLGDGAGAFGAPVFYPLGPSGVSNTIRPQFVVLADMDDDSDLDVVTTSPNDSAAILINDGAGRINARVGLTADGHYTQAGAVADLNDDGLLDIVTANYLGHSVTVIFGISPGAFHAFDVGANPASVAFGDVNGDGLNDLVTANEGADTVSVRLGEGTGRFAPRADLAVGREPSAVALGDVDADGDLDIVVANYRGVIAGDPGDSVSILLGDGIGGFGQRMDYPVETRPRSIVLGDIDEDGNLDIVTGGTDVTILPGDGEGGFGPRMDVVMRFGLTNHVALRDLNRDGHLDLIAANRGSASISVFHGDGSGAFAAGLEYGTDTVSPVTFAVGDINGDGWPDVVVADYFSSAAAVMLNDRQGALSLMEPLVDVRGLAGSLVLGDIDGDHHVDLIAAAQHDDTVAVLLGDGAGRFTNYRDFTVLWGPAHVILGDVDGDDDLDIITTVKGNPVTDYYSGGYDGNVVRFLIVVRA